jgi:ketosteroid isomerase-like protein
MANGDIIKGIYDAFATGNIPGVLGAMDANISWTEAAGFPYAGTYIGPMAIVENVFMKLATEWEGFAAVPEQIVDGGNTVVALGNYSGTYKATGKSMKVPFAHVYDLKDGKIIKFVQHTDTAKVAEVL